MSLAFAFMLEAQDNLPGLDIADLKKVGRVLVIRIQLFAVDTEGGISAVGR